MIGVANTFVELTLLFSPGNLHNPKYFEYAPSFPPTKSSIKKPITKEIKIPIDRKPQKKF